MWPYHWDSLTDSAHAYCKEAVGAGPMIRLGSPGREKPEADSWSDVTGLEVSSRKRLVGNPG